MNYKDAFVVTPDTKKVPADIPLHLLRFNKFPARWGRQYVQQSLRRETLDSLKESGYTTLKDLEGLGEEDLKEFKGIGKYTAQRLIAALEKASLRYRGAGFPWTVEVEVIVPDDCVDGVSEYTESEIRKAATSMIEEEIGDKFNQFFQDIQKEVLWQRARKLDKQKEDLEKKLEEIRQEIAKS